MPDHWHYFVVFQWHLFDRLAFTEVKAGLAAISKRTHIWGMNLDLTDEEAVALLRELDGPLGR